MLLEICQLALVYSLAGCAYVTMCVCVCVYVCFTRPHLYTRTYLHAYLSVRVMLCRLSVVFRATINCLPSLIRSGSGREQLDGKLVSCH